MKVIVNILFGNVSQEGTLPVGNGNQTFKWLANAAAYHFVHVGIHDGACVSLRNRRYYQVPCNTQLLPKNVYTEDTPFLHPDDVINHHLKDGMKVIVDLYDKLEFDEFGAPILSKWAFLAFRRDEKYREARDRYFQNKEFSEEMCVAVEKFHQEKTEQSLRLKAEIERPKLERMKMIMAEQMVDENMIEKIMREAWAIIKSSGALDGLVPDDEQIEIRNFFAKNYVEITEMYRLYSPVNSRGGTHELDYIELCKFLTETGILGEEHSNVILRIFGESHIRGTKSKSSIHIQLNQTEFFVALTKIAAYKYITLCRRENSKLRKRGIPASKLASLPTVPIAVETIYLEHILPVLKKMPAGSEMRAALSSNDVLLLFHQHLDHLCKVFIQYSGSNDLLEESATPSGSMTAKQFGIFAKEYGFIGSEEQINRTSGDTSSHKSIVCITLREVRQVFSASQHDMFEDDTEEKNVEELDGNELDHQELMDFSEFLEAVARLGVLKFGGALKVYEEENLSHYECIRLSIQKICSTLSQSCVETQFEE